MDTSTCETKFIRCKLIACATVMEEMRTLIPPTMTCQTLEAGLHVNPEKLRKTLQEAIDLPSRILKSSFSDTAFARFR